MKCVWVSYLLWVLGGFGWLGLHHFYLGDDRKAFLWVVSLGGCGLASLRDLFMIPRYCQDAVSDAKRRKSFPLLLGAFGFAYFFGRVTVLALCNPLLLGESPWVGVAVRAVACAVASSVTVSSGNRASVSAWSVALVSAAAQAVILLLPPLETFHWASYIPSVQTVGALSAAAFAYKQREFGTSWRRSDSGTLWRVLRLWAAVGVVFVIVFLAIFLNARITEVNTNGEEKTETHYYLRDLEWEDVSWERLFELIGGWVLDFEEIKRFTAEELDEASAFATMGLKEGASMAEVKKRFRELAKELHPDHVRGDAIKIKQSAASFAKMQTAYHLLIERHGRQTVASAHHNPQEKTEL